MSQKKLGDLIRGNPFIKNQAPELWISSVTASSSLVRKGSLFVATKGALPTSRDGHDFIDEAILNGASAIVFDDEKILSKEYPVPLIRALDSKASLSYLCEEFFDRPSLKLKVIGITGTNGKTSTSFMLHSILKEAGFNPKIMGTLGLGDPTNLTPLSHTTMDPEFISQTLASLVNDGVTHMIMEISSHALSLKRVEALNFCAVALTNITQDHLDFHGSIKAYTDAKARLFFELAHESTSVILMTNPFSNKLKFLSEPQMVPKMSDESEDGRTFTLNDLKITLPFSGDFHQRNAALASTIASSLKISPEHIVAGLKKVPAIPGRLQWINNSKDFKVVVDFAHTPDALENLLSTVKKTAQRIILVFGCGGDRDRKKRALMGKIAERFAEQIIITDDNPRSEDPKSIRLEILSGMSELSKISEIGDRRLAIKTAIKMAEKDDVVVIAGKGHENYQIYQTKTAFSDQLEAEIALDEL